MAFKFNTDFINLGPLTSTNFGIEPINLSNVGPVAPLSNADLLASASRASTSPVLNLSALQTTTPATTYEFDPTEFVGPVAPKATTTTTPSPLNTITLTPRTEQRDFTPAPLGSFETLKINPTLASKPTTIFDPGEFVGPVAPDSPKPSSTTDITITPSFIAQTRAEDQVKTAFDKVLGRQPSIGPGSGLEYWTGELLAGRVSPADLEGAIARGAQGGDRLAANKFLGTDYFKVADPTTLPYASLLQPTTTVTDQPSVIETYNKKAQEREEQDKPLFNTWEDLPNIDETEIQMAKDAGFQSPGAYFLAKVESTDPSLSSWRESTRQQILGSKNLRKQYEDLYKAPIDKDAEETIYQELKTQYDLAAEGGYKYKHESDLDEIFRSEAAKLAAGGVKSIYEIGTRTTPQSLTFSDVYEVDGKYFYKEYYSDDQSNQIEIRPDKILDVKQDYRTVYDDDTGQYIERPSGLTVVVEDKPKTELINKNTGDPLYDVILQGNYREDPTSYKFRGNETIDVEQRGGYERIHYNTKVKDMADYSFQMISDGQGNEIPFMVPVFKSTKTDLTPIAFLAAAVLGPYAMQIGSYLGATTAFGQAAIGAGVISGGTQLVVNGKIDPLRLGVSMVTAGLGQTGGFTGSDIATDAAQLAEQGLSSAQIADTLVASGVNPVTANLAGNFASAGISVEIAPMITAGTQNMGLTALAMGELNADALTKSFLTGAAGEASSLAVDKIIGDENLKIIADATGLSKDQAGSIATSAVMNGLNSEVAGTNNFFDAAFQTLVVSGVSTVTANKVATALDETTSSKGRAAIVGATKNITDVALTAGWNNMDVGDALETMAPTLIGNAIATYVRTPETTKTDDKAKVAEGVEVAGPADQEALAATRNQPLVGETASTPVTDDSGTTRRTVSGENNEGQPYSYTIVTDSDGNVSYSYQTTTGDMVTSATRPDLKSTQEEGGVEVTPVTTSKIEEKVLEPTVSKDKALEEIGKETTFSGAFDKARDLLGPGETFDWKGKSYSTATAEERPDLAPVKPGDVTQTDTGAAFHSNIGRNYTPEEMRILELAVNDNVSRNLPPPTSEIDFVSGQDVPVVGDKISKDIATPFVTALGTLTRGSGGIIDYTRGALESIEVIDSTSPLAKGMRDITDSMNKTADFQIGDWALNEEKQFVDKVRAAEGFTDKSVALAQAIYEHPSAVLTLSGSEIIEEIPSLAAMMITGGATAVTRLLSLGAGAFFNAVESGGQAYNETKQIALDSGLSEEQAHTQAQKASAGSAALGAVLGTFAEAPLVRNMLSGKGVVSTTVKREVATEFPEEFAQTGMGDYFGAGKFDMNNALSSALISIPIAGTTGGTIATGVNLSQTGEATADIISANETENGFVMRQEVDNILGSSESIQDATQSIASTLTDMGMDPAAAVAVGNTVAAEQVVNNINSQLPEDSKFSINNLNTLVGATDQGAPVTLGEYIGSSVSNVGPNIFVSPDIAIGTKNDGSILTVADISGSLDMTQTKGDITTQTTTQTNPETNTTIKTETKTGPDTNITTTTETNPNTNTQTNTVTNTNTNIQTEINVDANTVVATETNLDTNIKTDITTNVDKIIEDLIDTGVKPEDALKIAVEEVKEDAKSPKKDKSGLATTKKTEGIGGVPMFTSTPYEETDFEHQSLYTKGKVKPFEGVLDEFIRRFESEPSAPDQMLTKPESKMDSDYFVYGSQTDIDDVLGQAPPNTIPTLSVPAFGMRSGGLVPPFAGGGPLTMAAGKLRKDYRQGDAVEGPGDGQSDDIPAMLADGEFVIPADVVAALGNGSNKAGADKLYDMMHNIRRQARKGNPKDLPKPAKSPLQYITRR